VLNNKLKSVLFLATYSCVSIAADISDESVNGDATPAAPSATIQLDEVEVKAKRQRIITPLPGVPIDRETATTNIQSATGKDIAESKALNVTEFMNTNMQSVTVNDYSGNPFQQDLNFRGFTASPNIGTPQGISVYLDGVRINEAFGDVVNWDLIPMNAIQSMDVVAGSNPLFGLNTLGGAIALKTKNGFTDNHLRVTGLIGSWGRQQGQFSNGFNNGAIGVFTAYNHFHEDGWRYKSPSDIRQLFNNLTLRLDRIEVNLSALNVDSDLYGNGLLPIETAEIPSLRDSIYTGPDKSDNKLEHYNLNVRWDVTDYTTLSLMAYRRNMNQNAQSAEPYITPQDQSGLDPASTNGILLNGVYDVSGLQQQARGYTLQLSGDWGSHQFAAGLAYDTNDVAFKQTQQLGTLDAEHYFHYAQDSGVNTAINAVTRNNLQGNSTTKSIFMFDVWSPLDRLHISLGARLNWANVQNTLSSDRGSDLYNFPANYFTRSKRCKSAAVPGGDLICSEGDYDYRSFNPSIGTSWEVAEDLTTYGNISRGSRTPTVIELGCARDHSFDNQPASTNYQYGCTIPTALSSDPYLKQIRSTGYEAGFRGNQNGFDWNIGLFRTVLKDDILFVPLGRKNRGVFDNFGQTMRQGIEMGLKGKTGDSTFSLNYTWMRATFESPAQYIDDANSSMQQATSSTHQAIVNIKPGDQIPGMPNHILQGSWNYKFNSDFDFTLGMVAHSSSFVRGNENNKSKKRAGTYVDANGNGVVDVSDYDIYDFTGPGKIPGYFIFNLRANYKLNQWISVFAKADNLFDKNYYTAGDLGRNVFNANGTYNNSSDGTGWSNTTFVAPGAPRAIWIGLDFDLDWKLKKQKQSD
jgi:iron complex outermembrane recepter protein